MPDKQLPHNHGQVIEQAILEHMPEAGEFQTVSDIFKQLCDSSRIRIFWLLCHCEECVINLSAFMDMSSPAVSHHLRQLKASGLITSRREGKEVYYRAADTREAELLHHMIEKLVESLVLPCIGSSSILPVISSLFGHPWLPAGSSQLCRSPPAAQQRYISYHLQYLSKISLFTVTPSPGPSGILIRPSSHSIPP